MQDFWPCINTHIFTHFDSSFLILLSELVQMCMFLHIFIISHSFWWLLMILTLTSSPSLPAGIKSCGQPTWRSRFWVICIVNALHSSYVFSNIYNIVQTTFSRIDFSSTPIAWQRREWLRIKISMNLSNKVEGQLQPTEGKKTPSNRYSIANISRPNVNLGWAETPALKLGKAEKRTTG